MFDNIGEKIKIIAKVFFAFSTVICIIIGLYTILYTKNPFMGLTILIGGIVASIVSCFVLYGFGELVNNSSILVDYHNNKDRESTSSGVNNTRASNLSHREKTDKNLDFKHCQKCNTAFNSNTYIHYNQKTGVIVCHDCFVGIKNKEGFKLLLGIPGDKK